MQLEDKDSILRGNKRYVLMQGIHSQLQLNPSSLVCVDIFKGLSIYCCFVKAHIVAYYKSLIITQSYSQQTKVERVASSFSMGGSCMYSLIVLASFEFSPVFSS